MYTQTLFYTNLLKARDQLINKISNAHRLEGAQQSIIDITNYWNRELAVMQLTIDYLKNQSKSPHLTE